VMPAAEIHLVIPLIPSLAWESSLCDRLADEIGNHPVFFPQLQIFNTQRRHETVSFTSLRNTSNPSQYVRASLRVSWYATGNGKWEGVAIIGTI
jgi:hypothetical protein